MSTIAERFKEAMRGPPEIKGAALAKACGCSPPSVSGWLTGDTKTIEAGNLSAAAKFLNVDPDWLARGVGIKTRKPQWRVEQIAGDYHFEDPAALEAAALIKQLPKDKLPEAINFLKFLISTAPPSNGDPAEMAA